jgi:hypothetical protein
MDFPLVFKNLLQKFQEQDVHYALIGGVAMQAAGFERATKDIDFAVIKEDIPKIRAIMGQFGYELTHESEEFSNYWHPMAPMGCVDYLHAHRSYTRKMVARAQNHAILGGADVPVVLAEDIIGLKVQSMVNNPERRFLDMADIKYLIINAPKLDLDIVREYFHLFGMDSQLNDLLKGTKYA